MAATGIDIGRNLDASTSPLRQLLDDADEIGAIYRMDGYRDALVVTHDAFVADAVGLPQHSFLLACLRDLYVRDTASGLPDVDREIVLLRVVDTTPLPDDGQMDRLRAELAHEATYEHTRPPNRRRSEQQMIDPITANKAATFGVRCAVLGTFYDDRDKPKDLLFGSDLDTINASRRLMVYKPHSDSLHKLVSFLAKDAGNPERDRMMVPIGTLRYASTQRRERATDASTREFAVPVEVDIADFVAHKTAVFGMTRLGKSNTMKVIASSVFRYSRQTGAPIGQLIFDPAGEYSADNQQDKTSLASISDEHVVRYRFGARPDEIAGNLRPLALNLFNETVVEAARELVSSFARAANSSQYVENFARADVVDPPDQKDPNFHRQQRRARQARGLFYATLLRAGLQAPAGWKYRLPMSKALRDELAGLTHPEGPGRSLGFVTSAPRNDRAAWVELTADELLTACQTIAHHGVNNADTATECADWIGTEDGRHEAIATMLMAWAGGGWRVLLGLRDGYHSPDARDDYRAAVYDDLRAGKIVIVDLARGELTVQQYASERIINYLLARAAERFRHNQAAHHIQVFLEEAHILFDRTKTQKEGDRDPYVRLAREAGKYKIGMIYSTQQVSSVEPDVLDNTANWVVAHLNSDNEIKLLSARYEFARFAEQIKSAEDKGFVRLKTLSSRYIIPAQIRLFDAGMVAEVRAAVSDPVVHLAF